MQLSVLELGFSALVCKQVFFARDGQLLLLENFKFFLQICDSPLSLSQLLAFAFKLSFQLLNHVVFFFEHGLSFLILASSIEQLFFFDFVLLFFHGLLEELLGLTSLLLGLQSLFRLSLRQLCRLNLVFQLYKPLLFLVSHVDQLITLWNFASQLLKFVLQHHDLHFETFDVSFSNF